MASREGSGVSSTVTEISHRGALASSEHSFAARRWLNRLQPTWIRDIVREAPQVLSDSVTPQAQGRDTITGDEMREGDANFINLDTEHLMHLLRRKANMYHTTSRSI